MCREHADNELQRQTTITDVGTTDPKPARCQLAAYSTVSRTVGDTLWQTRTPLGLSMAVARSCYTQLCLSVCLSVSLPVGYADNVA